MMVFLAQRCEFLFVVDYYAGFRETRISLIYYDLLPLKFPLVVASVCEISNKGNSTSEANNLGQHEVNFRKYRSVVVPLMMIYTQYSSSGYLYMTSILLSSSSE